MRVWRVAIIALVSAGVMAPGAQACSGSRVKLNSGNAAKVSRATVCLLNRERAKQGLGRLKSNRKLRAAAVRHSVDMVEQRYFDHDGPAGDTLFTRAEDVGYLHNVSSWALAENIAFGKGSRGTPASIVRSWMSSSVHRSNILNGSLRHAGVGVASGMPTGSGGATYTLDLGYAH